MWWGLWWLWIIAAVILATLEVFAPVQIFLGFAVGALGVGIVTLAGFEGSLPMTMLIFAVLSLVGWIGVRRFVGVREGQVKTIDHDINDN